MKNFSARFKLNYKAIIKYFIFTRMRLCTYLKIKIFVAVASKLIQLHVTLLQYYIRLDHKVIKMRKESSILFKCKNFKLSRNFTVYLRTICISIILKKYY